MPMKKIKLHCNVTKKSADIEYMSGADMYKVYLYPGQETYLPWVEFCKDKDEAIEVGNRWVTSEGDYYAEKQKD